MTFEIHPAAQTELEDSVAWYDARSSDAGDQFLLEFELAIQRIAAFPEAWPKVSNRARRCRLSRFPYGIIYQIKGRTIVVLAIMHLHRRPKYWKNRK